MRFLPTSSAFVFLAKLELNTNRFVRYPGNRSAHVKTSELKITRKLSKCTKKKGGGWVKESEVTAGQMGHMIESPASKANTKNVHAAILFQDLQYVICQNQ